MDRTLHWEAVRQRIERANGQPDGEAAWLAKKLKITVQVVSNWSQPGRSVPADRWWAIADALQCSIDDLVGRAPPASWPFEDVAADRWHALSERQKGAVEHCVLAELDRLELMSGKRQSNGG